MVDFIREYKRVLDMALSAGIRNAPLSRDKGGALRQDPRELKRFRKACHLGYEKAQTRVCSLLADIRANTDLDRKESERRELILRKAIDAIAFSILGKMHVMRRLAVHVSPPRTNVEHARVALQESLRLNAESRETFALVADLTTFVHCCDLVRIDFRSGRSVSLIELKSGKVNTVLMEQVQRHAGSPDIVESVSNDPEIDPGHKKQAIRMARQGLRLDRIHDVLATDRGIDPTLNVPIVLSRHTYEVEEYDEFLEEGLRRALSTGVASATMDGCLHFGIGSASDPRQAKAGAIDGMHAAVARQYESRSQDVQQVAKEIEPLVPVRQRYRVFDPFAINLSTVPCRPFPVWGCASDHILALCSGTLAVRVAVDLAALMSLARSVGLNVKLSSRRTAEAEAARHGKVYLPTWGGRALCFDHRGTEGTFYGGLFARMIASLESPKAVLTMWRRGLEENMTLNRSA